MQIANYIIPLFLFPYLGRVLGSENFGKIMFVQAFVAYFVLFTDFGFNVSATKEIADALGNKKLISKIFWDTMLAKAILVLVSTIVFFCIILLFNRFSQEVLLFFIAFLSVISSFLMPLWFFQGLEKMEIITIINIVPRILMVILTLIMVKNASDYQLALIIQIGAAFISGIISLLIIFYKKMISISLPSFSSAKRKIADSRHIFYTSLSSNLYTTTNTVILGLLTNNTAVGIFSASDKIVRALIGLFSSINQVIFPRTNIYYKESKNKSIQFVKKAVIAVSIVCVLVAIVLFFGANTIVKLLFSTGFDRSVDVLRYSALLPLLSIVNGIIAINIFVTFGLKKLLLKNVLIGTFFSLIVIAPLVYFFKELGPVLCATFTELLILVSFIITLRKHGTLKEI